MVCLLVSMESIWSTADTPFPGPGAAPAPAVTAEPLDPKAISAVLDAAVDAYENGDHAGSAGLVQKAIGQIRESSIRNSGETSALLMEAASEAASLVPKLKEEVITRRLTLERAFARLRLALALSHLERAAAEKNVRMQGSLLFEAVECAEKATLWREQAEEADPWSALEEIKTTAAGMMKYGPAGNAEAGLQIARCEQMVRSLLKFDPPLGITTLKQSRRGQPGRLATE